MTAAPLPSAAPLRIGGVLAEDLAREHGTPLYAYDAARIRTQYRRLSGAFSGLRHKLLYALKANSNPAVLKLLLAEGAGLDAVSIDEVRLGLRVGFAPKDILFTPNSVAFDELRAAVDLGACINVDNLSVLEKLGHAYGARVPVCLRINPHIYAGGNANIQTGHIDSKFGISIFQLRHALRIVSSFGIPVEGLHMHTGSDILDAHVFVQAAEVLLSAAREFPDLRYLDFGSGFKVAYKPGDVTTDVDALGRELSTRLREFFGEYGRELEVWFEPGKYLVSEAGYLLVRCNVVKQTVSSVFVGVDSGLNHLIRPMFYQAYHQILNVSHPDGTQRVYTVVGNVCETDTFAYDRLLPEVREGDLLALCNAGAYGYSMASQYNSRPRPAEVLVDDGVARLVRRRETLDDLLACAVM